MTLVLSGRVLLRLVSFVVLPFSESAGNVVATFMGRAGTAFERQVRMRTTITMMIRRRKPKIPYNT